MNGQIFLSFLKQPAAARPKGVGRRRLSRSPPRKTKKICDFRRIFDDFYEKLAEESMYIYPGKMTEADCFRIGTIGQIYEDDIHELLQKVKEIIH